MKRIVIESPYAGEVARNKAYARKAMDFALAQGAAPMVSHLLYTQVLNDDLPGERALGITAGLCWYDVADEVWFFIDYGFSPGMKEAWAHAEAMGMKVKVLSIGEVEL